jgi:hypothetical protein
MSANPPHPTKKVSIRDLPLMLNPRSLSSRLLARASIDGCSALEAKSAEDAGRPVSAGGMRLPRGEVIMLRFARWAVDGVADSAIRLDAGSVSRLACGAADWFSRS